MNFKLKKKSSYQTIESIVANHLCVGCGTCVSICPNNALSLILDHEQGEYFPKLSRAFCVNCSLCYEVCPRSQISFRGLSTTIFGNIPKDISMGTFSNCYAGYSTDPQIRYYSASGGLVTQLLIFALEAGLIEGALVTRMNKNEPLKAEPFIATTKAEILDASKSKYCPVPINAALKEILKSPRKIAFVGLPCHIQGVRKAERVNRQLKERIVFHFGLVCSQTPNFKATELFLERMNIDPKDITKLNYRGEGWPGTIKIYLKNGEIKEFQSSAVWDFIGLDIFSLTGCLFCSDSLNELSDISFADAWLSDYSKDTLGTSLVIARSKSSERLLSDALISGKISLNKLSPRQVVQSQLTKLYYKKKVINSTIKTVGHKIKYDNILDAQVFDYCLALYLRLVRLLLQTQLKKNGLRNITIKRIRRYYLLSQKLEILGMMRSSERLLPKET